ncbi:MAG: metalloregulator ArsR/SmtB family transcription factor [Pseudohongiella sp.]|nr:metalloregulator ArsR/SmtB family transcription factor [Pseudohongiella sp.]
MAAAIPKIKAHADPAASGSSPDPAPDSINSIAQVSKALGDELRLEILHVLRTESFGVLELCRILDIKQNALSHHLKILATAGLVSSRREGNSIFYRRALLLPEDRFFAIKQAAFSSLDGLELRSELAAGIRQIHAERSEQSLLFFERHAERFLEKQELVAEYAHYRDTLHDLLDGLQLSVNAKVMEVGPGEGRLLSELASAYEQVIALDNSMEMLNRARNTISDKQQNVEFIHGDTQLAIARGITSDLLVYNMVLHHIPSPREAFQDSARILNAGGVLLLIDLSHHDQDWVRDACGDLWLGFESRELEDWAQQAGLQIAQSMYLGLRNGFQVQMRVFKKPNF